MQRTTFSIVWHHKNKRMTKKQRKLYNKSIWYNYSIVEQGKIIFHIILHHNYTTFFLMEINANIDQWMY